MSRLLRRTAAAALTVGGAGLLVLAAAVPASAQEVSGPVQVSVRGPATGEAGGTGTVSVGVRPGDAPVDDLRLAPVLPEGVTVVSVSAGDDWACVLGPLSCTLERRLTGGSAPGWLQVELAYDGLVEGPQDIAFVAVQGERQGAVRIDRGSTVVQVAAEPEPTAPAPEPTTSPAPASPAPAVSGTPTPAATAAAPVPAATRAPGPAPSPAASTLRSPAPVSEPAGPVAGEPLEPAAEPEAAGEPGQQAPAVLPFAETDGAGSDTTPGAHRTSLAATSTAQGADPVAALAVGIPLVLLLALLARTAARRRRTA